MLSKWCDSEGAVDWNANLFKVAGALIEFVLFPIRILVEPSKIHCLIKWKKVPTIHFWIVGFYNKFACLPDLKFQIHMEGFQNLGCKTEIGRY
jgi:hypothetical protein